MDHMDDLLVDLGTTLTCPSCHITIIPKRMRAMCPFCGSFYDPDVESDPHLRSAHRMHHRAYQEEGGSEQLPLVSVTHDHVRLPRLVRNMFQKDSLSCPHVCDCPHFLLTRTHLVSSLLLFHSMAFCLVLAKTGALQSRGKNFAMPP